MSSLPILRAAGLRYSYAGKTALDAVSLELAAGEIAVLLGRNGAGKSTLLRCLAGWTRPDAGQILLNEQPFDQQERAGRRLLKLVPDSPPVYQDLTAWEHLQLVGQAHRSPDWEARANELLERFELAANRAALPLSFSRGMRQKLGICLALLAEPQLLLLDEPFAPLDPLASAMLWQELRQRSAAGMSVLLSSHQLPPGAVPERYLVLEQGRIVTAATPAELGALPANGESISIERLLQSGSGATDAG